MDGFHSQTLDFFQTLDLALPADLAPEVVAMLDAAHGIRPFMAVHQRLRAILSNPASTTADVEAALASDVYFAQRLLSGLPGRPSRIHDVLHGKPRRTLLEILGEAPKADVFFGGDVVARGVWHESAALATLCRLLAEELDDCDPDEAHTAGLFHGLGELTLYEVFPTRFGALFTESIARRFARLPEERFAFATDHAEVGAACAQSLQLSPRIGAMIRFHHTPDTLGSTEAALGLRTLADVLRLADRVVADHLMPDGSMRPELGHARWEFGSLPLKPRDLARVWGHFVRAYDELVVMVSPIAS